MLIEELPPSDWPMSISVGHFLNVIDVGGPSSLPPFPVKVGLKCVLKVSGQARASKPVSSIPLWSLLLILSLGSYLGFPG